MRDQPGLSAVAAGGGLVFTAAEGRGETVVPVPRQVHGRLGDPV